MNTGWLDIYENETLEDRQDDDKRRWVKFAKKLKELHDVQKTNSQCRTQVIVKMCHVENIFGHSDCNMHRYISISGLYLMTAMPQ